MRDRLYSLSVAIIRPKPTLISHYLEYVIRSDDFQSELRRRTKRSSQGGVYLKDIRAMPIDVPPLAEQRRIVKLLDDADELRKLRTQADRRTAALIPALFDEMFGDPAVNSKGFRKEPLEKLIRVKSGEILSAKNMSAGGEYPVYGGNGISGYHNEFMFERPMIVIGRVGVYCGAVHLSESPSWVTDNALYISEFKENLDEQYLVAALRIANLNLYAGRAAQPLVSGNRIYPVLILVPPLPLQKEFGMRVKEIRELEAEQAVSRRRGEDLYQSMLHRAFSGEL
jgi:type I restriction enzyme S subunit